MHLIKVEVVLNSRLLTYLDDEIGEPLTPSHLIMGRKILDKPRQSGLSDVGNVNKLEHFRKRFSKEYSARVSYSKEIVEKLFDL